MSLGCPTCNLRRGESLAEICLTFLDIVPVTLVEMMPDVSDIPKLLAEFRRPGSRDSRYRSCASSAISSGFALTHRR
jgi:hypothetical protein